MNFHVPIQISLQPNLQMDDFYGLFLLAFILNLKLRQHKSTYKVMDILRLMRLVMVLILHHQLNVKSSLNI